MADPRPLTRKELTQFLPNQRAIRAFEKLFDLIPDDLNSLDALVIALENYINTVAEKSDFAVSAIEELRNSLLEPQLNLIPEQKLASTQSVDYITANSEKVICTDSIVVALNSNPDDFELVIVVATNGQVEIDGNGKNISGQSSITITQNYTSLNILYSIELDEWLIQ